MKELGRKRGRTSLVLLGCANEFNLFQNKTGRYLHICHRIYIVLNVDMFFPGEGVAKVYMPILVPVGVIGNVLSFLVGR